MSTFIKSLEEKKFSWQSYGEDQDKLYETLKADKNKIKKLNGIFQTMDEIFWFLVQVGFKENIRKSRDKEKKKDRAHINLMKPESEAVVTAIAFKQSGGDISKFNDLITDVDRLRELIHEYHDGGATYVNEIIIYNRKTTIVDFINKYI
ncbi:hypothetical protein N9V35_00715 [bacterium]|nr:hypothetical protein [bacterium]